MSPDEKGGKDDLRDAERRHEAERQEVERRVNSGTSRETAEKQVRDESYQRERDYDEYVRKVWGS